MTTGQSTQIEIGGRILTLETGRIAKQADGAVVVRYGETVVLATVVASKSAVEGQDFFPLSVDYRERAYAGGRIPGGFFKREGRPAEKEILTSRLIDRPIRPLFPDGFRNEVQVICLVVSGDQDNDPDVLAMNGASAALAAAAALVSLPLTVGALRGINAMLPPSNRVFDLTLDGAVVAATMGLAAVSTLVFGLIPAMKLIRVDVNPAQQTQGARQTGGKAAARFRATLTTAQIALSMALLVLAGWFAQSLANVARVNIAALASLARAPAAPKVVRLDVRGLDDETTLLFVPDPNPAVGYEVLARPTDISSWTRRFPADRSGRVRIPLSKDHWLFALRAIGPGGQPSLAVFPLPLKAGDPWPPK